MGAAVWIWTIVGSGLLSVIFKPDQFGGIINGITLSPAGAAKAAKSGVWDGLPHSPRPSVPSGRSIAHQSFLKTITLMGSW